METLAAALRGGVDLVQWRVKHPTADDHLLLEQAVTLCARSGVALIVNDDPGLASQVGAAGAHVGQDDLSISAARTLLRSDQWLGVSTHSVAQARRAAAEGADYLGFGPCFATATKGYARPQPAGHLRAVFASAIHRPLPVFAIGGITPARVRSLRLEGARRVAVSATILASPDPEEAARALRQALE